MNALPPAIVPQSAILNVNGRLLVDSRDVSLRFDRAHKSVLASIDLLLSRRPDLGPNFLPKVVDAETGGGGTRETRAFDIDRDGFALLVMGFTGERALTWKIAYIQAFNAMEAHIRRAQAPALDLDDNQVLRRMLVSKLDEVDTLRAMAEAERQARLTAEQEAEIANQDFLQTARALTIVTHRAETAAVELAQNRGRVEALQPKALAYDRIAAVRGAKLISLFAADVRIQPKLMFVILEAKGWIKRRPTRPDGRKGQWICRSGGIERGYVQHEFGEAEINGQPAETRQVVITPDGQRVIEAQLAQGSPRLRSRRRA